MVSRRTTVLFCLMLMILQCYGIRFQALQLTLSTCDRSALINENRTLLPRHPRFKLREGHPCWERFISPRHSEYFNLEERLDCRRFRSLHPIVHIRIEASLPELGREWPQQSPIPSQIIDRTEIYWHPDSVHVIYDTLLCSIFLLRITVGVRATWMTA